MKKGGTLKELIPIIIGALGKINKVHIKTLTTSLADPVNKRSIKLPSPMQECVINVKKM